MRINIENSMVTENEIREYKERVEECHKMLHEGTGEGSSFLGWVNLKNDDKEIERIKNAAKRINENSDVLIVIGIGGSYLGARAVIEALSNSFQDKKVIFAGNNVSPDYLNDLLDYIKDKGIQLKLRYEGEETKTTISDDNQSKDNKTCENLPKISLQKEYPKTNSKSCSNKSINEQPTNNQNYNSPHPYIMNCAMLFYGCPQCNNLYMNQINSAQYNQMQYMMNNTQTPNINLVSFSQFINTHVKPSFNVNNICIPSQIEQIVTYYQNNDLFLSYQYINQNI